MPYPLAAGLLRSVALYLLAGLFLLPWLYRRAWPAAAPGAEGASLGFRVAALPGTLLLWPLLLLRARRPATPTGDDPGALRRAQMVLALLAVVTVVVAILLSAATRPAPLTSDPIPAVLLEPR